MNKRGGFTDLFIFMVLAFTMALIIGVFIYMGGKVTDELHEKMDSMEFANNNASQVIDNTMGKYLNAIKSLRWLGILIIFGMVISIFIGSYLVTTRPIFFIPYLFVTIIAIIVSVAISNAYEMIIADTTLSATYATMGGINWILLKLPIIVTIAGFGGGLIMFSRLGKGQQQQFGY